MDERLDRRGFLQRVGTASFGFAGLGWGITAQDERQNGEKQDDDGQIGERQDGRQIGEAQDGRIESVEMVVPSADMLEPDFANRVVFVSEPNQPGFRPADACFPEVPEAADDQWHSYDATIVDPTETEGLFGGDPNSIGGFEDSVAFVDDPVPTRSLYRVVGGSPCDDGEYFQLETHELAPQLYEFFDIATEILDGDERDGAERRA